MERQNSSLIQSSVPLKRGPMRHYEHADSNLAFTRFRKDEVAEIHTPQDTLKRIHETLHARHTNPKSYKGIRDVVWQIVEDCRLHLRHWPWEGDTTPPSIKEDTIKTVKAELATESAHTEGFPSFAHRLRAHAVYRGIAAKKELYPNFGGADAAFAQELLRMMAEGQEELAAKLIEKVFFDDVEKLKREEARRLREGSKPPEIDRATREGFSRPSSDGDGDEEGEGGERGRDGNGDPADAERMEIIELEKVESTQAADAGFRVAASGARLYRPALRRPILSPRIFLKKAPYDPIGVVCFDASSSMGVTEDVLNDCCRRAPTAVVGYYQGHDSYPCNGWLWVYAREGMRANRTTPTKCGGNGVDDLAITWMLTFEGPRILVTDRGFTCPGGSSTQQARLTNLERLGEIEVCRSFGDFKKRFPPLA